MRLLQPFLEYKELRYLTQVSDFYFHEFENDDRVIKSFSKINIADVYC